MKRSLLLASLVLLTFFGKAQEKYTVEKDLQDEWLVYDEGYKPVSTETTRIGDTFHVKLAPAKYSGRSLVVKSARPFFLFFNGKLSGEYEGYASLNIDSLATAHFTPSVLMTVHQKDINRRDLKTWILSEKKKTASLIPPARPSTYFKDFVIAAGLIIIIVFLIIAHFNPKLATDYFSVIRIFSLREVDDAQANARITGSTNIQFYVACSLLLSLYLMIVFHHLPDAYALPLYFQGHSFGGVLWQWLRLSMIILGIFFLKILFIFSLTRLFGLRGLARIHFFNWVRLLLIVFGTSSIILFIYYISRGQSPSFFVVFLSLIVGTLMAWIGVAFLKLNGRSEHSMFHLFSYICATEIIPLLITIKVLFQ